jgi:hypothetical protein
MVEQDTARMVVKFVCAFREIEMAKRLKRPFLGDGHGREGQTTSPRDLKISSCTVPPHASLHTMQSRQREQMSSRHPLLRGDSEKRGSSTSATEYTRQQAHIKAKHLRDVCVKHPEIAASLLPALDSAERDLDAAASKYEIAAVEHKLDEWLEGIIRFLDGASLPSETQRIIARMRAVWKS